MIHVREYGASGPFVAVLHGGPGAPGYMAQVAQRLGDSWKVLEPFQRGSGQETLSVARHVADLHDVVTIRCGNKPAALVGHSWGAMLALAYAAKHPDRVASVVLIGSGTFTVEARERMRAILYARTDASLRRRVRMLNEECADPNERLGRRARLTLPLYSYDISSSDPGFEACDARAHQQTWDDMMRLQEIGVYPQAFETIRAPVVMLHGAADPHPGEMIREISSSLNVVTHRLVSRCNRLPYSLSTSFRGQRSSSGTSWSTRSDASTPKAECVSAD